MAVQLGQFGVGGNLGVILAAGGGPTAHLAARVFLAVAVIVVVAQAVSALFRRLGQPVVLGEIVAGIALGPSLLGLFPGSLPTRLFPLEIRPYLQVAAELGLVIFMFVVGLEIDPEGLRRSGRKAVGLSLSSIVVPLILGGAVLAPLLYDRYGTFEGNAIARLPFSLFLGVAMCGTAFAVLARILTERNMFRIPLGMLAIACAAIDDIVVFALLTLVVSIGSASGLGHLPVSLGELALFAFGLFGIVRPLLDRTIMRRYRRAGGLDPVVYPLLIAGALGAAFVANRIGLAALLGAFLFGAAVPRKGAAGLAHEVAERVEGVSVVVLLPVFFVATGLGVDIGGLGWSGLLPLVAVMATAVIGKFVGGGAAARLSGMSTRQSLALATLMNTRGLTELVILNVGRSAGLIDGQLFTMMVIMAVVTTVAAGPLLGVIYPEKLLQRDIADADRQRAAGVGAADYRVAVVLTSAGAAGEPGGDPAQAAVTRLIGSTGPAQVTLLALAAGNDIGKLGPALAAVARARDALSAPGVMVSGTARLSGDPCADAIVELGEHPVDCVVAPFDPYEAELAAIAALCHADVADTAVAAGHWASNVPPQVVLADLAGPSPAAVVEHAARLARGWGVPVELSGPSRAVRGALDQLRRAGYEASAGQPAVGGPPALAATVATVASFAVLEDRGSARLPTEAIARAAAAAASVSAAATESPGPRLLLVCSRAGERRPLNEAVPFLRPPAAPAPETSIKTSNDGDAPAGDKKGSYA